jgi:glycosyltransferase involved in cell wall biosynthesis
MPGLLILCEYPTLLGGERSMLATLPTVVAAGYYVTVAAPPFGELEDAICDSGVAYKPLKIAADDGVDSSASAKLTAIASMIQRVRPDVVHANSLSMARICGPVVADAGVPSVGHLRDIIKLSQQAIDDLNKHRVLVAVSEAARACHVAQGLEAGRCVVSYNGVDLDAFRPAAPTGYLHHELKLPPGARLIATIGQLGMRKGVDVALAAAENVARLDPTVHWLIVGERTSNKAESIAYADSLRSVAETKLLRGRVQFLGRRSDVRSLLNECVMLVHAARQEPLGRVLLEAAACGLPVVATDVGGTLEIFSDEEEGAILVPVDDPVAITRAAISLLNDERRRQVVGAAGRRRAELQFDIRQAAERLIAIYERVLS